MRPGPRLKPAWSPTWTPELAWAVGIIATDGCLSKDGRHVTVTSKDVQLLETIRRGLGVNQKIAWKGSGSTSGRTIGYIQIGSVELYRWLLSIGITPRKSKTISAVLVPVAYFWDFLRGCFDGDGSCYAYWDPRWRSSYMFYWELCSGSPKFIRWTQRRIRQLAGLHGHISVGNRCEILKYAKRESMVLFEKMYYDRRVPCLRRKHEKVESILRTWWNLADTHA